MTWGSVSIHTAPTYKVQWYHTMPHLCDTVTKTSRAIERHGKERKEIYAYNKSKIVLLSFGFVIKKTQSRYFIDVG